MSQDRERTREKGLFSVWPLAQVLRSRKSMKRRFFRENGNGVRTPQSDAILNRVTKVNFGIEVLKAPTRA